MIPFGLAFRKISSEYSPGAVLALVIFTCLDILFLVSDKPLQRNRR